MSHNIPQLLDTIIDDTDDQSDTIDVEINLLQLPIFALGTRSLRCIEGLTCQGSVSREEDRQDYLFRTLHTQGEVYPGPLARSAHFALMSISGKRRMTTENPLTWTWHNLCKRMERCCSGRSVQQLKTAIRATAELTMSSQNAVLADEVQEQTHTPTILHLYDKVVFANEQLDGRLASRNHLWVSQWYRENVNNNLTIPLDYPLWKNLDRVSRIASRMYEVLLPYFYTGRSTLVIDYSRLAQVLPVREEKFLSDARKQLEPAMKPLLEAGIIRSRSWKKVRSRAFQICITCGPEIDSLVADNLERDDAATPLREFARRKGIFGLASEDEE